MKKFYERYWVDNRRGHGDFHYKWPAIEKYVPKKEEITILDYGCGKGEIFTKLVSRNPKSNIIGADVSKEALSVVKKKYPKYTFVQVFDGEKLPFKSNTFDFICALDVLEHVYDTETIFKELTRVLKKDGKLLVSVPYHGLIKNVVIALFFFDLFYDPYTPHIRSFTKKSLQKCLETNGLHIKNIGYHGKMYPLSSGMHMLAVK
jgi:ubiquinone/menaquinone biosynthesis C-methylase UbiE